MSAERKILIVDSDHKYTEELLRQNRASPVNLVIAHNRTEALTALSRSRTPFASVLVNRALTDFGTFSVVRHVHVRHLGTPIYLLCEEPIENTELKDNLAALGVRDLLPKPLSYEQLIRQVEPFLALPTSSRLAIALQSDSSAATGTELGAPDRDFTPIRAQHFLAGRQSYFSVYVQIRSGRYLKLLNAGDPFEPKRLQQYLDRGVRWFHIRKEAHRSYIEYCDFIAKKLIDHGLHAVETQRDQVLNLGEETLRFFSHAGVSSELISFSVNFVQDLTELTKRLNLDRQRELSAFMNNIVEWQHGVGVALVASLLMRGMAIENDRIRKSVGLAALLHDIGKTQACPGIGHDDLVAMDDNEKQVYYDHPWAGATMLAGVPGIDSTTIQAIAQHHERRDGKGFPLGLGAGKINRVAEIVGLADEVVDLIHKNQNLPELTKLQLLEDAFLDRFSSDVVDSLCVLFIRN